MNNPPKILVVDDDEMASELAAEILSMEYAVRRADSGMAALSIISEELPDLVLLDVEMPGMNGYEICKALKEDFATSDLPVIFVSGLVKEEDRLAGYEAGGDDYLTKPVSADELRTKIKRMLANQAERLRLKEDLSSAFSTAMTAMSSSAEIGILLQFMRASFSCKDYQALANEVINAFNSYGLETSVRIHGSQGAVSLSTKGPCTPLEETVLTNMAAQGRLFEFGLRTSCSYDHITIIVKEENRDNPDSHGRMRDNLAILAEGASARVEALDSSAAVSMHESLAQITTNARVALQGIDQRHREHGVKNSRIFDELQTSFDLCLLTLGITQSQEEELANMIQHAANRAKALHEEGQQIGVHMEDILRQLERAGK
jgi:DNA-binding response OmpR family regulator